MPTYDLVCDACEHGFETFRQGFLRDQDRVCPECGTTEVHQLITGFITARPVRNSGTVNVQQVGGGGCCGGSCGH